MSNKKMYLTNEGTLTSSVTEVVLSKDEKYYHTSHNIVSIYDKINIKDFDKLIEKNITVNECEYNYPSIDGYNLEVTYSSKEDSDVTIYFSFNKEDFIDNKFKPNLKKDLLKIWWSWETELWEDKGKIGEISFK